MRVTGGRYKGRKLSVPRGQDIRPTTDKVRQAIFNILLSYDLPQGAVVLDAFCGTGALGIEALSRGAESCLFMDKRRESLACTSANIKAFVLDESVYRLLRKDSTKPGSRIDPLRPASLAFFDPPYRCDMVVPALENTANGGFLADAALCVIECEKQFRDSLPPSFTPLDRRIYGDIQLLIARYKAQGKG